MVAFSIGDKRWTCDVRGDKCAQDTSPAAPPDSVLSPDGKRAAFIREFNLWVRDVATGKDVQLTRDGVEGFRVRHRQRRLDSKQAAGAALVS